MAIAGALSGCGTSRTFERRADAARGTIAIIHRAESQYYARFGRFGETLGELASVKGTPIPQEFATKSSRFGYRFRLVSAATSYGVYAEPLQYGFDGTRTFYSPAPAERDAYMTIYEHDGPQPATEADLSHTYGFKPCLSAEPCD